MTPEEAKEVLQTAEQQAGWHQWAEVTHLLRPVHESRLLSGTDQGDAAYFLGWAALNQRVWDEAYQFLTEAASTASHEHQTQAHTHLTEIDHHNSSDAAEVFGSDQGDFAAVIAAGDEAIARGDFAAAQASYRAVYDGTADDNARMRGALGLATAFAYQNDFDQAAQFAHYVQGNGPADLVTHAAQLLDWIAQQQGAQGSLADGTTVDEFKQLMDAGRAAMFAQDYAQAEQYYRAISDSAQFGNAERAKAAHNLGMALLNSGDPATARACLDFAVSYGLPETQDRAHRMLEKIDRQVAADHLVEELIDA